MAFDNAETAFQAGQTAAMELLVNRHWNDRGPITGFDVKRSEAQHYRDFNYPTEITFALAHRIYHRNGIARAGVEKTIGKTWEDNPWLLEKERDGSEGGQRKETTVEREIRQRFADLRVWQHMAEADRRSLVGRYAGLILRFADNQMFDQPVVRVPGGLQGLVEVIPAWEGQLTVSEWDNDQRSESYGHPKMFQFNEAAVGDAKAQPRSFNVHPDRVIVWSRDGTVHGRSFLEPGYNDLLTMEKIIGAGGEGFWKNAKSAPVLEVDATADLAQAAKSQGLKPEQFQEALTEHIEAFNAGFDKFMMVQGMTAKTLGIILPSPEHFFAIALQSFAASIQCPLKILVGSQTGERASTEDAEEWAKVIMGRRNGQVIPNALVFVNRLERVGILPERDWHLDWTDLLNPSPNEMLERVERMAAVNEKMKDTGEFVFTPEELRSETGREPLSDAEKYRDPTSAEDEAAALGQPAQEPAPAA